MIGIYCIKNLRNDKRYVGQSSNVISRWSQHIRDLKNGSHNNRELQYDFNRYGIESFSFNILEELDDRISILERENYYINKLKTNLEYNRTFVDIAEKEDLNTYIPIDMIYNSNVNIRRVNEEGKIPYICYEIMLYLINQNNKNLSEEKFIKIVDIARFRGVNPRGSSPYRTTSEQLKTLESTTINNIKLIEEVVFDNNGFVKSVFLNEYLCNLKIMAYNNNEFMSLTKNTTKHLYLILSHKQLTTSSKTIILSKKVVMNSLNVSSEFEFDFKKKLKSSLSELVDRKIIKQFKIENDELIIKI